MAQAAKIGSICSGHGCFPPRQTPSGSSDVFVEGIGSHRLGDYWLPHCCSGSCHSGTTISASTSVFVNGIPKARVGDTIDCGSTVMTGASTVFVGG